MDELNKQKISNNITKIRYVLIENALSKYLGINLKKLSYDDLVVIFKDVRMVTYRDSFVDVIYYKNIPIIKLYPPRFHDDNIHIDYVLLNNN